MRVRQAKPLHFTVMPSIPTGTNEIRQTCQRGSVATAPVSYAGSIRRVRSSPTAGFIFLVRAGVAQRRQHLLCKQIRKARGFESLRRLHCALVV